MRKQYEPSLRELVEAAVADLGSDLLDARLQVFSVLVIGTHLATWCQWARGDALGRSRPSTQP